MIACVCDVGGGAGLFSDLSIIQSPPDNLRVGGLLACRACLCALDPPVSAFPPVDLVRPCAWLGPTCLLAWMRPRGETTGPKGRGEGEKEKKDGGEGVWLCLSVPRHAREGWSGMETRVMWLTLSVCWAVCLCIYGIVLSVWKY